MSTPEEKLQLRQALIAALIRPEVVLEYAERYFDREDADLFKVAVDRGLAYEDEPSSYRRLIIIDGPGSSMGGLDLSMVLQEIARQFAVAHGLKAEQMIELLGLVIGRYAAFAALEVLESKQ